MIRLDLSNEPTWLDLGHGVLLHLQPLTTALMVASRNDPAVAALDEDTTDEASALIFAKVLDQEKNVSASLPNGSSAGARDIVKPASPTMAAKTPARTARKS